MKFAGYLLSLAFLGVKYVPLTLLLIFSLKRNGFLTQAGHVAVHTNFFYQ